METAEVRVNGWLSRLRSNRRAVPAELREPPTAPDAAIGADAPIRSAAQDRLRRVDYADRIAAVLSAVSLEQGRVFAIRGGWGFGKSSLKHLVMERLKLRDRGADFLDFNPWQWGDGDAIARALFSQIANGLGGTYSEGAQTRAAKLRSYGAVLTGAADPVAKAGRSTGLASSLLTNASVVALASAIGFSLPTAAKAAAAVAASAFAVSLTGRLLVHVGRDRTKEPLDRIRRSLEASLRGLDRPLVVFVDDIDRLEPEQIRGLMRQVKANANLPNIVFVLIFQPSIVEAALAAVADGDGAAFLEKIVQASFDLPAVPVATVHRLFTEELSEIASVHATAENGFEQVRWGNSLIGCIQPHVRNLRDARRLLSSIVVHLPLQVEGDTFEVNVIDFLILETLRVFEPALHALVFAEQDLLLQARRFRGDGREAGDRERIQGLVSVVPADRRTVAEDVLKELFPQVAWAFGGTTYAGGFGQRWLSQKRVNTRRYLPRYFELQTQDGEVSEGRFVTLLGASSDRTKLLRMIVEIERDGLLPSLAQRFDEGVDRLPVADAENLLPAMFAVAQKLVGTRSGDPMNSAWVSAWRAVSWFLSRVAAERRGALAIDALRETGALSVGAILIHLNDPADRDGDDDRLDPSLDPAEIAAMKTEWLRQIVSLAAFPEALLAKPDMVSLLYRWRDYSGSFDAPRAWVSALIQEPASFVTLVVRMMSRGTTSGWGDRVAAPYDTFGREVVEDLVGIDEARRRIEAIDPGSLGPDGAHAIDVLRKHLVSWSEGGRD